MKKLLFLFIVLSISGFTWGQTTCYPDAAAYNTGATDGAIFTQNSMIRTQSASAERGWARFNTTAIPDGDNILTVELHIYVSADNYAYFKTMPMEADPLLGTPASVFADCGDINAYVTYASNFPDPGWYVVDLGAAAATDLKSHLVDNWFAVGLYEYEGFGSYFLEYDGWFETNPPYIIVTHAIPNACPAPTLQTVSAVTTSSADLGWNENGTATLWDIEFGASGFVPTGNPTYNDVTANPYSVTTLSPNTTYDWYVRADCGGDNVNVSTWVGPYTFTTACAGNTIFPWTEDFEGAFLPPCWSKIVHTGNDITQSATQNHTISGLNSARFSSYSSSSDYNQYLFSEPQTIDPGYTQLSFWHRKYNTNSELLEWGISTSTDPLTFTWTSVTLSNTIWQQSIVDLTPWIGQTVYIGFHYYGNFLYYVYLDDVSIDVPPSCPDPTAQTASNFTANSADLSWSENGSATTWEIELGITNFIPTGVGTPVTANPTTWSGLAVQSTYDWYVRSNCGGSYSAWVGPHTFTVPPLNNDCANATAISEVIDMPFNSVGATAGGAAPGCGGSAPPNDIWYSYTASYTGTAFFDLCGSAFDTRIALWDACGGTALACNDDYCGLQSAVNYDVIGGNSYLIQVGGYSSATGAGDISIAFAATNWTGAVSNDWSDAGNWTMGVPGSGSDVIIPAPSAHYPTLTGIGYCNNILLEANSIGTASLMDNGFLTVGGSVTAQQFLDAQATPGGNDNWHFVSSPVSGATANVFHLPASTGLNVYLQAFDEPTNTFSDVISGALPSTVGFSAWVDGANATPPVTDHIFAYNGGLVSGSQTATLTRTIPGLSGGNNLVGNPYPSAIDWDAAGLIKTNVQAPVFVEDQGSWGIYDAINGATGTGNQTQFIGSGQGFFVFVNDDGSTTGVVAMDNSVRVHNDAPVLKSEFSNILRIQATGNGRKDIAAVHFIENANALFDGQEDALKLFAADNSYPQIYTLADRELAANALPETEMVSMGFKAGVDGNYTIEAIEINDIQSVWLEDTFNDEFTDLSNSSYSFSYTTSDDANRFILHFAALGVNDQLENPISIYSSKKVVNVIVPEFTDGSIGVYNMIGQEVARGAINGQHNIITLAETGYYVVVVTSNENVVTQKVLIK